MSTQHALKSKYFESVYQELNEKYQNLSNQTSHFDFVLNDSMYSNCCDFLKSNKFGCIVSNIPKPIISSVRLSGNDQIIMNLSKNNEIAIGYNYNNNDQRGSEYELISYQISFCYHCTQIDENTDEKQDKMQWQSVDIECTDPSNPFCVGFEIEDFNLVNADLMIKIRYLLKKQEVSMWTAFSEIYELSQNEMFQSMSNIVSCFDEDVTSTSTQQSLANNDLFLDDDNIQSNTHVSPLLISRSTNQGTVRYHDDDNECPYDEDDEEDEAEEEEEVYNIDLVAFKEKLCFDQSVEQEMVQNQQLIQQFMKGITAASKRNNELIESIKQINKQKELWMDNKFDIMAIRKKPKLSFLNPSNLLTLIPKTLSPRSKTPRATMAAATTDSPISPKSLSSFPNLTNFRSNAVIRRHSLSQDHLSTAAEQPITNTNHCHHNLSMSTAFTLINSMQNDNKNKMDEHLWNGRIRSYGELCHILQENPMYLAILTPFIQHKDIPLWCQTVCCDLFGNESDSRNEHLLLRVFECILERYHIQNNESLLSEECVLTKMFSAFMNDRCPQNKTILIKILEGPMHEIIFDKRLNLQIDPRQVCKEFEFGDGNTESTSSSSSTEYLKLDSLNSPSNTMHHFKKTTNVDNHPFNSNEIVQKVIFERMQQIRVIVTVFLDRMIENAQTISFGIRWLCKMISDKAQSELSDATQFELDAVIGSVIYLRYIQPALNAPFEFLNLPRNGDVDLILCNFEIIAQILRNIFCNEPVLSANASLSHWIKQQQIETVSIFYSKLLDLNKYELQDRLAVDRHLICCKTDIELNLRQIYLLHHQMFVHQADFEENNSFALVDVLQRLDGDAPYEYNQDECSQFMIHLDLTLIDSSLNGFFLEDDEHKHDDGDENNEDDHVTYTMNQSDSGFVNIQYNANHSFHCSSKELFDGSNKSQVKCNDHHILEHDESYVYNILFWIKFKDDSVMRIRNGLKELFNSVNLPQNVLYQHRYSLKNFLKELKGYWLLIEHDEDKEHILHLIDAKKAKKTKNIKK